MAKTQHVISPGFVKETKKPNEIGFYLEKWLKKALTTFGVALDDECCDAPVEHPISIDNDGFVLVFNHTTREWDKQGGSALDT